MKVVIPAAGLATRFLPTSHVVPKELLPLGHRPLIHHALQEALEAGFDSAIVVISARKAALRRYFDPDPELEATLEERGQPEAAAGLREAWALTDRVQLSFVLQPEPRGLGEAVLRAGRMIGEAFAVLLPDDVIIGSEHWRRLQDLHAATGAPCLCVRRVPASTAHRYGIAVCEDDWHRLVVRDLVEKPGRANVKSDLAVLGRYVVTPATLDALERLASATASAEEVQLTTALAATLREPPGLYAVPFSGEHYDVGTPAEYARSHCRFGIGRPCDP